MADVLTEYYKSRKLHQRQILKHEKTKGSAHDKSDKIKPSRQKLHSKPKADYNFTDSVKAQPKDSFKSFDFIHGENLFPLERDSTKRSASSRKKLFPEGKGRDFCLVTKAETEIKMKVPKIHEPRIKKLNPERDVPLKDVKRRLEFGEDDIKSGNDDEANDLDFTDKLAALRSLIGTGLRTSQHSLVKDNINKSNRLTTKASAVTRSDSLKENRNFIEVAKTKKRKNEARATYIPESDKIIEDRTDTKITEDRLSALTVDLHALKDRLFEKRRKKLVQKNTDTCTEDKYLDKFIDKNDKVSPKSNGSAKLFQEFEVGEALDHASPDRKIITSTKKFHSDNRLPDNALVNSKQDHKEIQTDFFNQSTRSVQSNAPFYDPSSAIIGNSVKRPVTPLSSSVRKKFDINQNIVSKTEGISKGLNLAKNVEYGENSSHIDAKQTNVDSFVGTSLTPEKDKGKAEIESKNKHDRFEGKGRTRNRNSDLIDWTKDGRTNPGKSRLKEKYKKMKNFDHIKGNLRPNDVNGDRTKMKTFTTVGLDRMNLEDDFIDHEFTRRIVENTNKTEKKVREWIQQQEKLETIIPEDSGPMTLDELSVSLSLESKEKEMQPTSPTDTCDKIPVKIEKWENEREFADKNVKLNQLNKFLPVRSPGRVPKSYPDGDERIETLELDLPVKHLPPLKTKPPQYNSLETFDADSQ